MQLPACAVHLWHVHGHLLLQLLSAQNGMLLLSILCIPTWSRSSFKTATRTKHVVARPNTLCGCGAKGHRQWQAANVPALVMLWLLQLNLEVSWAPLHCGASPWDEGLHASGQTSLPLIFALIGNS